MALSLEVFPRISEKFKVKRLVKLPTFSSMVTGDKVCKKIGVIIGEVITCAFNALQRYLDDWLVFRHIWETDKDVMFARFERKNPTKEAFSLEIDKYFGLAKQIRDLDHLNACHFLFVNSLRMRETIIKHCDVLTKRFKYLLFKSTARHIEDVYKYCHQLGAKVNEVPQVLSDLPEALKLHSTLVSDVPRKEDWFPMIDEQLTLLLWYSDDVPEEMNTRASGIKARWAEYLEQLDRAEEMLENVQATMKQEQLKYMGVFKMDVSNLLKDFQNNAPFSADKSSYLSLKWIDDFAQLLEAAEAREKELIENLYIFRIRQPPSEILQSLKKSTEDLGVVWILGNEWDNRFEYYKQVHFRDMDVEEMETYANETYKKFTHLIKLYREKNWPCIEQLRKRVENFKRLIPMLQDLKNPNLKKRHWDQIREVMGADFDENDPGFTLDAMLKLNFNDYAEHINDISNAATMEIGIENQLTVIRLTWQAMELNMEPHKDKGVFKLKGVDELFNTLEEHQNILSAMKGSRYAQPFMEEVDYWEKTLGLVLDVLEHALIVQKNYLYLENIFAGEDITKQLPKEADNFERISREWKFVTKNFAKIKNAVKACGYEGLLKIEKKLIQGLEMILKALEKYLETKRRVFPRFYFISNDDLLEILGSSKRPENIQPHFKKCFDNINRVKMQRQWLNNNRVEGFGMSSADEEYVPFTADPLVLEGPVEIWLCNLETRMRQTLREAIKMVRLELKTNLRSRDKWVLEHPGQLCITASQIQWTSDVTRTLLSCRSLASRAPMKRLKKRQVLSYYERQQCRNDDANLKILNTNLQTLIYDNGAF